jgi:rhodanese-related sulfurtransferase
LAKNHLKAYLLLFIFLGFAASAQKSVQNADPVAFQKLIASGEFVLIDLRTPGEIEKKGKIAGAREIDFLANDAEKQIAALDPTKKYLLYCAGGGRSSDCASLMSESGVKELVNLTGGFDAWAKKGFPVEHKKQ